MKYFMLSALMFAGFCVCAEPMDLEASLYQRSDGGMVFDTKTSMVAVTGNRYGVFQRCDNYMQRHAKAFMRTAMKHGNSTTLAPRDTRAFVACVRLKSLQSELEGKSKQNVSMWWHGVPAQTPEYHIQKPLEGAMHGMIVEQQLRINNDAPISIQASEFVKIYLNEMSQVKKTEPTLTGFADLAVATARILDSSEYKYQWDKIQDTAEKTSSAAAEKDSSQS